MKNVLLCLLLSLSVSAQTWEYWGTYKNKTVFINPKLTRKSSSIIQISIKTKEKKSLSIGRFAFNCRDKEVMQIKAKSATKIFDSWDNFYSVKPNTFGAWLYQRACLLK